MTFNMRCNFRKVTVAVIAFGNSASSGMAQQTRQGTADNWLPLRDIGEFPILHRLLGSTGARMCLLLDSGIFIILAGNRSLGISGFEVNNPRPS
jgi:hypothetical protein